MLGDGLVPSLDDGQKQTDRLVTLATDRLVDRREGRIQCGARSMSSNPTTLTSPGTVEPQVPQARAWPRSPWRRS